MASFRQCIEKEQDRKMEWFDPIQMFEKLKNAELRIREAMKKGEENTPGELRDMAHQAARVCAAALEYAKHIEIKHEVERRF